MTLPLPGPQKVDCPDGCGKYGMPVKSRSGHVRGCPCKPCVAGVNSRQGKARHRKFGRALGVSVGGMTSSNEESWDGPFRVEVKTGQQVYKAVTGFMAARAQSEAKRPLADGRPFLMGLDSGRKGDPLLVQMTVETLLEMLA